MNILIISVSILALVYAIPNIYHLFCGLKTNDKTDDADYRDKYVG